MSLNVVFTFPCVKKRKGRRLSLVVIVPSKSKAAMISFIDKKNLVKQIHIMDKRIELCLREY